MSELVNFEKMYDVAALDFETATNNNYSACSLGITLIKDLTIVAQFNWLIQPPANKYSAKNSAIHGMTSQDTAEAPLFPEVWQEIHPLLKASSYVCAHNAQFDLSVLHEVLRHYKLITEDFSYFDSITYSTKACAGEGIPSGLKERCLRFKVPMTNHHDALADALACGNLVIACTKELNKPTIPAYLASYSKAVKVKQFQELKASPYFRYPAAKNKRFKATDLKQLNAVEKNTSVDNPLFLDKSFVFTGDFKTSKDQLMQTVVERGGILKSAVSGKTDYVVEGVQDLSIVGADGLSGKQRKARELIEKGGSLKILTEKQLKELF